jgi:GAF domain-containing protein/anti-sigma regulatory factor (Ser/Thr protein kinase)
MASSRSTEPVAAGTEPDDVAVERLHHLHALTEAALAHLTVDELLEELLLRVRKILTVDTLAVLLLDEERGELVARAAKGLEEEVERGTRVPVGSGFAGRVAASRTSIVLREVTSENVVNPILLEKGVRSLLGVPLMVGGRVLGVVHVGSLRPREFDASERELLELAADRMALAIDHARLFEAERQARIDAERAAARIEQIHTITDVALGFFSLDEDIVTTLLDRLRDALAADTAAILLLNAEGTELVARAARGIEEEVEQGVRIPIGGGFAGRIVAEERPVFLPDVDHTKVLNPILLEKGIRSLLGVPLMVESRAIGVVHVGSLTPREFSEDDTALLELAADRIAVAIDRARQHGVARTLQQSLLPAALPALAGFDLAARYLPSADDAHVGGDWYDVLTLPGGRTGLVMGDVVSHGVRAAASMGALRTALRAYAHDGSEPAAVLTRLNDFMRTVDESDMATIAYMVIDSASGRLEYTLAGHPPPLVLGGAGEARFLEGGRSGPVGVMPGTRFEQAGDELRPGETLLLYTDGLVERRGEALEDGLARLGDVAVRHGGMPDELCDRLVEGRAGAADDVAVLAVRRDGAGGERLDLTVRAVPESLSGMRRTLGHWLAARGADEDVRYDILVAVGEAAANAVEHAYGPVESDFTLTAEGIDGGVSITISDRGQWRSARGTNRGRGIDLMRQLMDEVDVTLADNGTIVRMTRGIGQPETAP